MKKILFTIVIIMTIVYQIPYSSYNNVNIAAPNDIPRIMCIELDSTFD